MNQKKENEVTPLNRRSFLGSCKSILAGLAAFSWLPFTQSCCKPKEIITGFLKERKGFYKSLKSSKILTDADKYSVLAIYELQPHAIGELIKRFEKGIPTAGNRAGNGCVGFCGVQCGQGCGAGCGKGCGGSCMSGIAGELINPVIDPLGLSGIKIRDLKMSNVLPKLKDNYKKYLGMVKPKLEEL